MTDYRQQILDALQKLKDKKITEDDIPEVMRLIRPIIGQEFPKYLNPGSEVKVEVNPDNSFVIDIII